MFTPTGYEHSILGTYTTCICDQCTNNNCENCRSYKNIGYSNYRIEDCNDLYESDGIDAVTEKYGVEVNTYILYFQNKKLKNFNHEISISDINLDIGVRNDTIVVDFYYNRNQIATSNTGKKYSDCGFINFIRFRDIVKSKAYKDLKLVKTTKKELVLKEMVRS